MTNKKKVVLIVMSNLILKALQKKGIKATLVGGDDIMDDAINIDNHPLELNIQVSPYSHYGISVCHWTNAKKIEMKFSSCRSVEEAINKVKNILKKDLTISGM